MISGIARFFLMFTALAPIGFTYACVAVGEEKYHIAIVILVICAILTWATIRFMRYAGEKLSSERFKPTSIETADGENIPFMLLYMLPLFENGFGGLNWITPIPAIGLFALVMWSGYGFHFNPLLGIMKWHFYRVGTKKGVSYLLITKKQLRTANQELEVALLTEFIVLDKGE